MVETWSTEFSRTKDVNKRLAMIYLANDVLQNSRKKGAQFVVEFYHKLPLAMQQLVKQGDSKVLHFRDFQADTYSCQCLLLAQI